MITVDPNLQKSEEIADFLLFMINEDRIPMPKLSLRQILMAKIRPGMSAEILTAAIVSRFSEAGIPSGPLVGGAPNVMEQFVKIFSEEVIDMLQNDMRIDLAVDPGISVTTLGANSGGPVTSLGASTSPHTGVGIAR